tara:strand:+ start:30 stop:269 length:240 start_codon:yes stop_codon:yes gene_type:complete
MKLKKSLTTELKNLFKEELKIKVNERSKIYDHKKWDSLGNFNLLLVIEKRFKITFNSQEFNQLNTFKNILKIVEKKFKN